MKWVVDQAKFYSFMVACAARTGQLLNATDIGNTVDVDRKTVKAWLSVLQASNIVRIVEPYWPNVDKRLTKTPKIFFMDTGLVCHLTRWITPEQLRNGAAAGHIFEAFVVSEILKSFMNAGKAFVMYGSFGIKRSAKSICSSKRVISYIPSR